MVVGFSWLDINPNNLDYPPELISIPTVTSCTFYCDRSGTIQSTGYYIICNLFVGFLLLNPSFCAARIT